MKKLIFGVIFIATISIIFFFVIKIKSFSNEAPVEEIPTPTIVLPTISENIKVDLKALQNNKVVVLKISGLSQKIDYVEYELTYTTGNGLPRGVLGKITTYGKSDISRDDIVLGTCSSGKCVYDTGVDTIELSLKFNSLEGPSIFHETYQL